jgi:hypothetical protein
MRGGVVWSGDLPFCGCLARASVILSSVNGVFGEVDS